MHIYAFPSVYPIFIASTLLKINNYIVMLKCVFTIRRWPGDNWLVKYTSKGFFKSMTSTLLLVQPGLVFGHQSKLKLTKLGLVVNATSFRFTSRASEA